MPRIRPQRSARPTKYTAADHARIAAVLARNEEAARRVMRKERLARLAVFAGVIILGVALFYGLSGGAGGAA